MLPPHLDSTPPETWRPARRAVAALASPIHRILAVEAASGILLLIATVVALVWANSPWGDSYVALWHTPIAISIGDWTLARPLEFWINDGLMTVFFLLVGLEIRREMFEGELQTLRRAALPIAAAVGGMLVPAALYAAINRGGIGASGWAIPMATDIAFALGVLTLLGSRVPNALRILLLGLAVIDDIGAIIVIGVFYSDGVSAIGLAIAGAGLAAVLLLRSAAVRSPLAYAVPGVVVWAGLLHAGIHPTLTGVLLGLMTPARSWFGPSGFEATAQEQLTGLEGHDKAELLSRLDIVHRAGREAVSPVDRLVHVLHPWIAFGVMPLFAVANAGVVLRGAELTGASLWIFAGVVAGLVIGKPVGIAIAAFAAKATRVATAPADVRTGGLAVVGIVAGIGFTMALFIANLSFSRPDQAPLLGSAKLGILAGSGLAIVLGLVVGMIALRRRQVERES
ncbi:MAG: Na+/H+ antiporter NhaA [Kofleriaceae bacterium]